MGIINRVNFLYHWTKGERALKEGRLEKAKRHKDKATGILLSMIRKS